MTLAALARVLFALVAHAKCLCRFVKYSERYRPKCRKTSGNDNGVEFVTIDRGRQTN